MSQDNNLYLDGYRYGVMFTDNSVADWWNGSTQRQRAEEFLSGQNHTYPGDAWGTKLVRRVPDGDWVEVLR